jgi:hypothetical protein
MTQPQGTIIDVRLAWTERGQAVLVWPNGRTRWIPLRSALLEFESEEGDDDGEDDDRIVVV